MEQKERKKHERQESASSSRRNGFSNCFSCRSYSSNTSFVLLVLLSVQNFPTESLIVHTADLSALIRINLSREGRQEAGRAVGARAAGSGWEGLEGRPAVGMGSCSSKIGARGPGRGRPSRPSPPPFIHPRPYGVPNTVS